MKVVLGISDTHNAAAATIDSSGNLRALQEERPLREKNYSGFPKKSIYWLLEQQAIKPHELDIVALAGTHQPPDRNRHEIIREYRNTNSMGSLIKRILRETPIFSFKKKQTRILRINRLIELGVKKEVIKFYDHHLCHASSAYYSWAKFNEPILIVTCDGAGDGLCATINIGEAGHIRRLYEVDWSQSFGILYAVVTYMMGMVPLEHEYKMMGMAPYAKQSSAEKIARKLCGLFEWSYDGKPQWKRCPGVPPIYYIKPRLQEIFFEERFDTIMAGTQLFIERMVVELVKRSIKITGIHKVALSGGVFMNVKANKEILALEEVEDLFVMPSCGDETNAIGACYLGMVEQYGIDKLSPINGFYLGPRWSSEQIKSAIVEYQSAHHLHCELCEDINQIVAQLLANGEVVARFNGCEEFGARSLGNRAIIADPRNPDVVPVINEMIKNRDFWMPFAASILDSYENTYICNDKNIAAPYMILSFDTTERGRIELKAGVHPYDHSCRPQIVTQQNNEDYWDLINKFSKITGVGGLLNTSLNLHGYPLVHKPGDALEVLVKSGLKYLACGPFLISKK